jgi:hypothetical protein
MTDIQRDLDHIRRLQAFIEDVKTCQHCNTSNMRKVVYCVAHKAALHRMEGMKPNPPPADDPSRRYH